jgi:CHAD domain-containing protein
MTSAHDLLAPELFALIGSVRHAAARVTASRDREGGDPEAIHDLRVAIRRLRTALRPARRVYGKRRLRQIGGDLGRFAQATGALRDEEVLREILGALELPARARRELDAWLARRARQERARRRAVVALLTAGGPGRRAARPPGAPDEDRGRGPEGPTLAAALARLERRLGRRGPRHIPAATLAEEATFAAIAGVRELSDALPSDAAAMHALRIRFKRLRYTAELFAPVLPDPAAALAKPAARMQKRLGELHDLDEALVRVARARSLSDPAAAAVRRALVRARVKAGARVAEDLRQELGVG